MPPIMNKTAIIAAIAVVFTGCGGEQKQDGQQAENYELLTIKTENHEVQTEYAAQVKGRQNIRIIPRVEGYLQDIKGFYWNLCG